MKKIKELRPHPYHTICFNNKILEWLKNKIGVIGDFDKSYLG